MLPDLQPFESEDDWSDSEFCEVGTPPSTDEVHPSSDGEPKKLKRKFELLGGTGYYKRREE